MTFPAYKNSFKTNVNLYNKSFAETLCDGYRFEVKPDFNSAGIRALFYYKAGHSLLITHVFSNRVHVLNLATGELRWFDHHGITVRSVLVCNHEIVTSGWDEKVCVTNFDTLDCRMILTDDMMGRCPYVAISPDLKFAYSYSYDSDKNPERTSNTIRKWSLTDGHLVFYMITPGYYLTKRRCGSCEVYDTLLYVVSDTGFLHIYNSETGILLGEDFYNDHLQSLCILPAFNMVAFGGEEGTIYLCNSSGKRILQKNNVHSHNVSHLIVHPDKPDTMISIGFDGKVNIWRLPDMILLGSTELNQSHLWSVTVINDLLITGGENGDIWIHEIKNLPNITLKGKLVVSERSYAYMPASPNSFYTSDLSMMQVRKNGDCSIIENQFSEYLLNTGNSFRIFKELFSAENNDRPFLRKDDSGFYQISKL